jgi:hypothetical protein
MGITWARTIGLLVALLFISCAPDPPADDDDDDDTVAADDDDDALPPPPVLPQIEVERPDRATFQPAGSQVVIAGHCIAGDAPLDNLSINDVEVDLTGGGDFTYTFPAIPGINVVNLRVEDTDGERAVESLGLHYGPTHGPAEQLTDVAVIHVSAELLDDDNPDLDDTASLLEGLLEDPQTFDDFLVPMESEYVLLTPTSIEVGDASVDIDPHPGTLVTSLSLGDLYVSFDAEGTGMWSWVSVSGEMWADPALVQTDLNVSIVGGQVMVDVPHVAVTMQNFELQVDYVPSFLEPYIADAVQEYVEESLQETAQDMVGVFMEEFLQAFAVDMEFGEENPVTLQIDLGDLQVSDDGITFWLDGRTTAEVGFEMPDWAGSLITDGAAPSVPFSNSPLNLAVDDDFVNQLFFTLWYAGALSGWSFGAAELADMGAGDIPPPLGPVAELSVDMDLPMVLTATDTEGFNFDLSLGEVRSRILRDDGVQQDYSINLRGGANVIIAADGSLQMVMDDRPAELVLGVGVVEYPEALDPGDLAALVRLIIPPMLAQSNDAFPGFPLPETELSELADIDYFYGKTLAVTDLQVSVEGDPGLWMLMEGGLLVQ